MSKEASVYFGFVSVLRVVHFESKPPRINLFGKFLLQLNISSQTNHPIIGKSDLSGTNFPTLVLLSSAAVTKVKLSIFCPLSSEQWLEKRGDSLPKWIEECLLAKGYKSRKHIHKKTQRWIVPIYEEQSMKSNL